MSALPGRVGSEISRVRRSASFHVRRLFYHGPRIVAHFTGAYSCAIRVQGVFRPSWAGNLAAGIAEHGLSVRHGHAIETTERVWTGELEIERTPTASLLAELDLVAMADRDRRTPVDLPLSVIFAESRFVSAHGGALLVEIEARDRVGFLAALLDRLAFLGLFLVGLDIVTDGNVAKNRVWLKSMGRRTPDAVMLVAVSKQLADSKSD